MFLKIEFHFFKKHAHIHTRTMLFPYATAAVVVVAADYEQMQ
jgi:hypothetical protein